MELSDTCVGVRMEAYKDWNKVEDLANRESTDTIGTL